jgi:hypothetical protein
MPDRFFTDLPPVKAATNCPGIYLISAGWFFLFPIKSGRARLWII